MNQSSIVRPYLDKANGDLSETTAAMRSYFGRCRSNTEGQMDDVRAAVEGLTRAIASVSYAVDRLAELVIDD